MSRRGTERFARVVIAAQKSAEGIVAAGSGEGPNDGRVIRTASSCGQSGRTTSWSWPLARQ